MTSIPKNHSGENAPEKIDPNQLDFFVSPEEAQRARDEIAQGAAAQNTQSESPEDRRRREWRERWNKDGAKPDEKAGKLAIELSSLRGEYNDAKSEIYKRGQTIRQQAEEIDRLKQALATATQTSTAEKIRAPYLQGVKEVEVHPRLIVTLDVDCGHQKHRPHTFQIAITRLDRAYVRAPERGDGAFVQMAIAGPMSVEVKSVRVNEPTEQPEQPTPPAEETPS